MKFEYKIINIAKSMVFKSKNDSTINADNLEEFQNALNVLGNDGWELIEIIQPIGYLGLGDKGACLFKRKI